MTNPIGSDCFPAQTRYTSSNQQFDETAGTRFGTSGIHRNDTLQSSPKEDLGCCESIKTFLIGFCCGIGACACAIIGALKQCLSLLCLPFRLLCNALRGERHTQIK